MISDRPGGSTSRWAIWSFPGLVLIGAGIGLILGRVLTSAGCPARLQLGRPRGLEFVEAVAPGRPRASREEGDEESPPLPPIDDLAASPRARLSDADVIPDPRRPGRGRGRRPPEDGGHR